MYQAHLAETTPVNSVIELSKFSMHGGRRVRLAYAKPSAYLFVRKTKTIVEREGEVEGGIKDKRTVQLKFSVKGVRVPVDVTCSIRTGSCPRTFREKKNSLTVPFATESEN